MHTSSENTSWGKPHWYKLTIGHLKRYCENLCQWHRCAHDPQSEWVWPQSWVPSWKKKQILADTLSRVRLVEVPAEEDEPQVNMVERISISETKYAELQQNTANKLHALYIMIQVGWPETKQQVPQYPAVLGHKWWATSSRWCHLPRHEDRNTPIHEADNARSQTSHGTHLGIVKCKQRAKEALYWPAVGAQIEEKVKDCTICHDYASAQQKEPSIPSPIADLPWAMGASNIFIFESEQFLVLVDYYVKYIEVTKLKDLTSQETIQA